MKTVEEIIVPHKDRLQKVDYKKVENCYSPDLHLFMKWAYRVKEGWYGFALGNEVPFVWALIIDDFLDELKKVDPNFKIQQIKLKFGGLRFYVELNLPDENEKDSINNEIQKLQTLLMHKDLIY
jgi:hypothetical protein